MTSQGRVPSEPPYPPPGRPPALPPPRPPALPAPRPPAPPKVQVQRSLSRDTLTIRFSARAAEEDEEEEELYGAAASSRGTEGSSAERGVATAVEASEELLFEGSGAPSSSSPRCSLSDAQRGEPHTHSPALAVLPPSSLSSSTSSSSWSSEPRCPLSPPPAAPVSSSSGCSPSRAKPFFSRVKSLSAEAGEVGVGGGSSSMRHRHLMKTLVKSLSSDTARPAGEDACLAASSASSPLPQRPPADSRLNLHLFKPFSSAQPRVSAAAAPGGDSKTAPSSPLCSPDGRAAFFRVQEVEARIEDTRRRLSEVMSEPLLLLSKIIGEDAAGGGGHRPKQMSSSATELTSLAGLNGHAEGGGGSDYCIKEEDAEGESPAGSLCPPVAEPPPPPRSPPLGLDRCSMSALARLEDEDFCELYSEEFELCADGEADGEADGWRSAAEDDTEGQEEEEDEEEEEEDAPGVPHNGLFLLISMVYGYFVLPLPPYLCAVLLGVAAGFMLAIFVVWLSAHRGAAGGAARFVRRRGQLWNVAQLDIKEPGIFKGWMNEIHSYDAETYHATLTHSVFVRLEGSVLRLSKPNRNVARRAAFNEPKPDVTYISQKIYDLTDSKICLVPQSLARKRVWNKKYPICIELTKQEDFMSKAQGERPEPGGEERAPVPGEKAEAAGGNEEVKRTHGDPTLFLFGRTGREKEEWFRRILLASKLKSDAKKLPGLEGCKSTFLPCHSRSSSRGSLDEVLQPQPRQREPLPAGLKQKVLDYRVYMAKYVAQAPGSPAASPVHSPESSPGTSKKFPASPGEEAESEAWVNALLGRIFWDFLGETYWADVVSKKIQMKLSKIRLPYFMNELTLTELDMGIAIPKILKASEPSVDHQGLWFDLEISYNGSFLMSLETKMNLARLGKEGEGLGEQGKEGPRPRTYCLADSDEESSSAGSSDEEDPPEIQEIPGAESYVGGHRPSKIMRFVDKIAKNKYFQKATETEFIKKKMEEVSNTPLLLTVEVQECHGTLAVNIPPPPTDRIWYGFRSPPHLELKARPKLGEREVTFAHVTDWIEKKLDQEFQKIFVMPNMDDIWLPIMHSAMDVRSNANLAAVTTDALKDLYPSDPEVSTLGDL